MSPSTDGIPSPTRHCQIAECSESIGRSQASGLRMDASDAPSARRRATGITRWPPSRRGSPCSRSHDLARLERCEHGAETDHAAGGHHDQVDVLARGQPDQRVGTALAGGIGRQLERSDRHLVGERNDGRSQLRRLFGEERSVGARGERHDPEGLRVRSQHVDRLPPDRSG